VPRRQDVNQDIHAAAERVERELESLIQYLNDKVVPMVRKESTSALRTASSKLASLADYLDEQKRKAQRG